ncbi:MAG: metallophosphoesterase [Gemmatimonadetes bacterium]|nr:metallophosphoesterase [Gemmatimonadota bacterium]
MSATTIVGGEPLELHAERAIFWPRRCMLLIADPHFGKAASFRALGVYVPKGTTTSALARITTLIASTQPTRIVFLGDFLHAREGRNADTFAELARWRASHAAVAMQIVRGNHDKRAGDPPCEVGIECVDGPLIEPPFALAHHPVRSEHGYMLAGHIHPCATLTGPARQRERLPCFSFSADVGILPAFGEFTGCAEVRRDDAARIWVVADDRVIAI